MLKITNLRGKTVISADAVLCTSTLAKARGLMFSKRKDLIFVFDKPSFVPLHMFFVFFPIDVLFLDSAKRIVELKKSFMPFSYYRPHSRASFVVELSRESSVSSDYRVGDILSF